MLVLTLGIRPQRQGQGRSEELRLGIYGLGITYIVELYYNNYSTLHILTIYASLHDNILYIILRIAHSNNTNFY